MAGLVPAIHALAASKKYLDAKSLRASTPVFDGVCPGMTNTEVLQITQQPIRLDRKQLYPAKGCVAAQCRAMSTRRVTHTASWLCT